MNEIKSSLSPKFYPCTQDEANRLLETALGKPLREVLHKSDSTKEIIEKPYQVSSNHSSNTHMYIVIPYRDRPEQLKLLLSKLNSYFEVIFDSVESFKYTYFIVEQADSKPFNRGILFNIAAILISQVHSKNLKESEGNLKPYLCFHDVDTIPRGRHFDFDYCASQPCYYFCPEEGELIHLYGHLWSIGGVFSIRLADFWRIGGFSNYYWGWGWEDNDFQHRCHLNYITINRTHFSERLTGAASFKEMDRTPIDLYTSIPANQDRDDAIVNRIIFEKKLQQSDFYEGLKESQEAKDSGEISVWNPFDKSFDLETKNSNIKDPLSSELKQKYGSKLLWYKVKIDSPFYYSIDS